MQEEATRTCSACGGQPEAARCPACGQVLAPEPIAVKISPRAQVSVSIDDGKSDAVNSTAEVSFHNDGFAAPWLTIRVGDYHIVVEAYPVDDLYAAGHDA